MIRLSKEHAYSTSRDYEAFWNLAQKTSIICFLDYSKRSRDVAATMFSDNGIGDAAIKVSSRKLCYIYAETMQEFKGRCESLSVEFIVPHTRIVSKPFPKQDQPEK